MRIGIRVLILLVVFSISWIPVAVSQGKITSIALFPIENLTGSLAPVAEVRQSLLEALRAQGLRVLPDDELDAFMARHRIRYAAGIEVATSKALKDETATEAVLIASLELYNETVPPKVAMIARLIATGEDPRILWADDVGMAGDDSPGILELGLVNDQQELLVNALNRLMDSLTTFLQTGSSKGNIRREGKFRPKMTYRGLELKPDREYTVAILPFYNPSERKNAGEILALLFIRHLLGFDRFRVLETGVVREQLLQARIIMDEGISLADAELVADLVDADLILSGRVIYYQDYPGPEGRARAEFSTILIEKRSRRVVWSSDSFNEGMDGVRFFGRGRTRTAHAMATQMVRLTSEMIAGVSR